MASKAKHYLNLNSKYLKEAEKLIEKKDYVQASEKLWGACAEIVKAVAEKRGKRLRTHGDLWDFVRELDMKRPEWGLRYLFLQASALHSNFYEDELPGWAVESGAESVKAFIEKMKSLL